MLIFNQKIYAKLHTPLSTGSNGYYERIPRGFHIYNRMGVLVACLITDHKFAVNAQYLDSGHRFYAFDLDDRTADFLGLDPNNLSETQRIAFETMLES